MQGADSEIYNQQSNPFDQIFGFIICDKLGLTKETFLSKCAEEVKKRPPYLVPNIIVSLHDGVLVYLDTKQSKTCTDSEGADAIYLVNKEGENFQQLLSSLHGFITRGRTTDVFPFNKYIINNTNYPPNGIIFKL